MTIIVALKDEKNKQIIIGADKQATQGQLIYKAETKLIELPISIYDGYGDKKSDETLHIAFAGSLYIKEFLQEGFNIPPMESNQNFINYMYTTFIPKINEKLVDNKLIEVNNNNMDANIGLICVFKGEIYELLYNFGVVRIDSDFHVNGSGYQVAIGSLYTNLTFHPEMDKKEMVSQAIISAGANTIYCDVDVEIKTIKY